MIAHIIFIVAVVATLGIFGYSVSKIFKNIRLLKKAYPLTHFGQRLKMLLDVAIAQTKIMRFPLIGFLHALVFWGFLLITIGSAEMVFDGLLGVVFDETVANDRIFSVLGPLYTAIIALGDVFAFIILLLIVVFLIRRQFVKVERFEGEEMRHKDHKDAAIALFFILFLMISLLGMNTGYVAHGRVAGHEIAGAFPVSSLFAGLIDGWSASAIHTFEMVNWWTHILLIFAFANYLPYSKHFHVFMSLPNVFLSKLEPLTQLDNMDSVKEEVKLMMNPDAELPDEEEEPEMFGVRDVEQGTWKNYLDSLTCTQCGRCTSVCPANLTGKKLSPRKIVLDFRRRIEEKEKGLHTEGREYDDGKALYGDYTTKEELWACTTCNACAQECPVNIDHPNLIVAQRRYIYLEESDAPSPINAMCTNIENNGAPWQYSQADRLKWADDLYINEKD